jgi:hypothetical protein
MASTEKREVPFSQPALLATLFTLVVGGAFLGALYNTATSHHRVEQPHSSGAAAPASH